MPGSLNPPYRNYCGISDGDPLPLLLCAPASMLPLFKGNVTAEQFVNSTTPAPVARTNCGGLPCGAEIACDGSNGAFPARVVNTFTDAGTRVPFPSCAPRGYKNIQARRQWHGEFGFLDPDGQNAIDTLCFDTDGSTLLATFLSYRSAPSGTKYLTKSISSSMNYTDSNFDLFGVYNYTNEISGTYSVNANSGVRAAGGTSNPVQTFNGVPFTDGNPNPCGLGGPIDGAGQPGPASDVLDTATDPYYLTDLQCVLALGNEATGGAPTPIVKTLTGWSASGGYTENGDTFSYDITVTRSDTSYTWDCSLTITNVVGNFKTWAYSGSIGLSGANTSATVISDAISLTGQWNLSDDALYPWRTDGNVGVAPLVTRNEVPTNVAPNGFQFAPWVDPNAALFDGSILGTPNPAGYAAYFDSSFQQWTYCEDEDGNNDWYIASYGDFTPGYLPQNATQWTNQMTANIGSYSNEPLPKGQWMQYAGGQLLIQQWVEIKDNWPSYNFARPCGADDRSLIDQTTVDCDTCAPGDLRFPDAPDCDPADSWNDNTSKGDWVLGAWAYDLRTGAEVSRVTGVIATCEGVISPTTDAPICSCGFSNGTAPDSDVTYTCSGQCIAFSACTPNVMTVDWSTGFALDEVYNSFWHADTIAIMPDLLWQAPACDGACDTDDGDTPGSGAGEDPPGPVEALCGYPSKTSSPTSPPLLPTGVTFPVFGEPNNLPPTLPFDGWAWQIGLPT